MSYSNASQIAKDLQSNGFCFPIDVFAEAEAGAYRAELEGLEREASGLKLGNKDQLNYPHLLFRFAYEIASSPRLLDAVEAVIGPDIMLWGSSFFIKEPGAKSYVSWHQDLRYWGLEKQEALVSAWLALSPATRANGCMRFLAGSHRRPLVEHRDSFSDDNILTRGQEAAMEIDEAAVRFVELRPGQASLHHGRLLHASAPNHAAERRIGYVMNFVSPSNRQVVGGKDYAVLLRGEDRFGHFEQVPPPESDLSEAARSWHARVLKAQNESLYEGAAQGPT